MFGSGFTRRKTQSTVSKLNLVSLMDIFTILVFFLLLNAGEAEQLENAKFIKLPDSQSGTPPHGELVVLIAEDAIWLNQALIVTREEVESSGAEEIASLREALAAHRERRGDLSSYEQEHGLALTIMGDHAVSYGLLKQVMTMARLEQFRDISLAVNQVSAMAASLTGSDEDQVADLSALDGLSSLQLSGSAVREEN